MEKNSKKRKGNSVLWSEYLYRLPKMAASAFVKLKKWYLTKGSSGYVPSVKMDFDKE
jgi:hypothetical protein